MGPHASLNREYIPHIAAFAYAILDHHYDRTACSFSWYRKFSRDLIAKKAGTTYETDAEFYDGDQVHLQIEAKASEKQTTALARAIERHGTIDELPTSAVKEVEYVLDLAPRYLWVVGPGSIDPPQHVYAVELRGPLNAAFNRVEGFLRLHVRIRRSSADQRSVRSTERARRDALRVASSIDATTSRTAERVTFDQSSPEKRSHADCFVMPSVCPICVQVFPAVRQWVTSSWILSSTFAAPSASVKRRADRLHLL